MQMICALLIFGDARFAWPADRTVARLDIQTDAIVNVRATLAAQQHRRFIKTHTPLDGLPFDDRVSYICVARDPRDAAISSGHHLSNMNRDVLPGPRGTTAGAE